VYALQTRPHDPSPYRVKWSVDGRDRTRSARTKAEAELLRSKLLTAAAAGEPFDAGSGLPMALVRTTMTFASLAALYISTSWDRWAAASRRSALDALTSSVAVAVLPKVRNAPSREMLVSAMRAHLLTPERHRVGDPTPEQQQALDWLQRASLPLAHLDVAACDGILAAINRTLDGGKVAKATFTRRRGAFYSVLEFGVRRQFLAENPMKRSEWKPPKQEVAVDRRLVMSVAQCREAQAVMRRKYPHLEPLVALLWMAGLRVSEAAALQVQDADLPEEGWGLLRVSRASVDVGSRWTDSGTRSDRRGLKWRAEGHLREVPIPPELVATLRRHVTERGLKGTDLFVTAKRGGDLNHSSVARAWTEVRNELFPAGHPLRAVMLRKLRHSNGTMLVLAGVPIARVAQRLGHSPEVCMRVYQGLIDDDDRDNGLIDRMLEQ